MVNVVLKFSPIARRHRHRVRGRLLKALAGYRAPAATWSVVETELLGPKAELADRVPRVHKVADYLAIYESVIDRTTPLRLLEIGSVYGDSAQKWRDYLHPGSSVVGVDIDSGFVTVADPHGTHIRMGAEQTVSTLSKVAAEFGPFDAIIDAGSQRIANVVNSFDCLFESALRESGVYLVEDVYCDYWTLYVNFSLRDVVGALIDAVRGHYRIATSVDKFRDGHILVVRRDTGSEATNRLARSAQR